MWCGQLWVAVHRSSYRLAAHRLSSHDSNSSSNTGYGDGGLLAGAPIPRSEFTSNKLASKLAQQLKVPGLPKSTSVSSDLGAPSGLLLTGGCWVGPILLFIRLSPAACLSFVAFQ